MPSWAACIRQCSTWGIGCADVSFVPSRYQNCYTKSAMQNQRPDSWVGIAVYSSSKIDVATKRDEAPAVRGHYSKRQADEDTVRKLLSNGTISNTCVLASDNFPTNDTVLTSSTMPSNSTAVSQAVRIVIRTNRMPLNTKINGNLFMSIVSDTTDITNTTGGSSLVATLEPSTTDWGDKSGGWLHYYPESLGLVGFSRLRLADWEHLPKGSKLVSLIPFETATGESMLVAVDTDGDYAWAFFCGIKGQLNKVFLVEDTGSVANALSKLEKKFTITGGQANHCVPLAL